MGFSIFSKLCEREEVVVLLERDCKGCIFLKFNKKCNVFKVIKM